MIAMPGCHDLKKLITMNSCIPLVVYTTCKYFESQGLIFIIIPDNKNNRQVIKMMIHL